MIEINSNDLIKKFEVNEKVSIQYIIKTFLILITKHKSFNVYITETKTKPKILDEVENLLENKIEIKV